MEFLSYLGSSVRPLHLHFIKRLAGKYIFVERNEIGMKWDRNEARLGETLTGIGRRTVRETKMWTGNGTGNVQREGECKISFNYINYPKCLAANVLHRERGRERGQGKEK